MNSESYKWKQMVGPLVKWLLFAIVLIFVVQYGRDQLRDADVSRIQWAPGWWFVAGIFYFISWIPAACLWWLLLKQAGISLPLYTAVRAHFCGHLGKYVPGKALSLVIRAAMLKEHRVPASVAGVLATVETLITMAVGVVVTIALIPILAGNMELGLLEKAFPLVRYLTQAESSMQYVLSGGLILFAILMTPVASWVLQKLITKINKKIKSGPAEERESLKVQFSAKTILLGSVLVACGWLLGGCSLGCLLQGCSVPLNLSSDPVLWTIAVAGATSLGFLVLFAPGGLGVREAIMIPVLQLSPEIDPAIAVIAVFLFRVVSLLSELFFSLVLYWFPIPLTSSQSMTSHQ